MCHPRWVLPGSGPGDRNGPEGPPHPREGRSGIDPELLHAVRSGEYVVDVRAVAGAMLRSGVFVAGQSAHGPTGPEQQQP